MNQTPEDLGQRIREAQEKQARHSTAPGKPVTGDRSSGSKALRAGTDLVAALVVGGFLGYWLDRWLGTKPWGMIILFFAGSVAGFMNIYRSQTGQDYKIGFKETKKDKE